MAEKLCFYYDFAFTDEKIFAGQIREFIDNGVKDFVITNKMFEHMLQDHGMISMLHNVCRTFEVNFSAAHAPYGRFYDLNIPDADARKKAIKSHIVCMNAAAGLGCRTYTVHVGAYHSVIDHMPLAELRPLAHEMLAKLIPYAEQAGIIIAVENSFEIPNSAAEVRALTDSFPSPFAGICFDSGHANCMASGPEKTPDKYAGYIRDAWWENGMSFEDNAIDILGSRIVTCHLHDNDGFSDQHSLPGTGTVDWGNLVQALKKLPALVEYQTEVTCDWGTNWAGRLPAPAGGFSIRRQVETFKEKGF